MTGRPTIAQKSKLIKYLVERDGFKCYLCGEEFKNTREPVLEHLNNSEKDNREDNLALAHQSCNIKKIQDRDMWDIASKKLEENQAHMYVGESFLKKDSDDKEPSTEIEISNKCYQITEEYLTEEILKKGWISYKGLIHTIVFLCRQKVRHGSEQSIRSHIKTLTSVFAPFEIAIDRKKGKVVKKRKEK